MRISSLDKKHSEGGQGEWQWVKSRKFIKFIKWHEPFAYA
jgi:hypothetical protein